MHNPQANRLFFRAQQWLIALLMGGCLLLSACDTDSSFFPDRVMGYAPVYVPLAELEDIRGLPPQPLRNPGRILIWQNYLLVNELYEGVHIIDNENPANPVQIGFIKILGNVEIGLKDNVLFADNYTDLITIDLTNFGNLTVSSRLEDVFEPALFPPVTDTYFQCADTFQGIVVGWEFTELTNPQCYRP